MPIIQAMRTHSSQFTNHLLNIVLLAGLTLLVFWKPIASQAMPLHTDGQFMTFPALAYFKYWASQGHYPVWWITDSIAGNMADTGSIGPAWLLFMPLFLFLKMQTAWFLLFILMYLAAGLSMYLYLNLMTKHPFASLFGAILFMRSEWVVDCLVEPQIQLFLFPLTLFFVEKFLRAQKWRFLSLASISLALLFLGSNVNYPIYLTPMAFLYFAVRAYQEKKQASPVKWLWAIMLMALSFLTIVWFRLYMLGTVGLQSTRVTAESLTPIWMSPVSIFATLFPDFFHGASIQFPYMHDRLIQGLSHLLSGSGVRLIEVWYPGLMAIPLLFFGLTALKRHRWGWAPTSIFFLAIVYLFGGEMLLYPLIKKIPLLNMVYNTQRITVLLSVTVPILSALGLYACLEPRVVGGQSYFASDKWLKRFAWFLGSFFALLILKDGGLLLFNRLGGKEILGELAVWLASQPAYQQPASFYQTRIDELMSWLQTWASWRSWIILGPILLYITFYLLYGLWRKKKISSFFAGFIFLLLIVWDSFIVHPLPFNTLLPRQTAYSTNPAIEFLKRDPSLFRFLSIKPEGEAPFLFPWGHTQFLPSDKHLVHHLSSVHGYQAIAPRRYAEVYRLLTQDNHIQTIRFHDLYQFDPRIANLLNVKYVVTKKENPKKYGPLAFEGDHYLVYENTETYPRAYLASESIIAESPEESAAWLKNPVTDLRHTIILEGPETALKSSALSEKEYAKVIRYTPHEIVLNVLAYDRRILFLSESFHPRWQASINNQKTPIYAAHHAFRGVEIPKGLHHIRFYLEPFSYRLYFLGIAILLILYGFSYFYFRRKEKYV